MTWFFRTGKGEYGEGDKFAGLKVPLQREIAKEFKDLSYVELGKLLSSEIYEERLIALLILVERYCRCDEREMENIFKFYLRNRNCNNNRDLLDLSPRKL